MKKQNNLYRSNNNEDYDGSKYNENSLEYSLWKALNMRNQMNRDCVEDINDDPINL